ncbi:CpaF family protein [Paracidobacterium acidisoli]|uniref:CpaF family protein n=1 Tax=Paracidobacterium acidisoli TaxID=2303751 RepID=A0A372IJR0_9BACT|nr:ATPase, T2SS/T4P/T4SS family [Paracidobacterium acidisoli]MBT9333020.1 Flp pilus assembly complex ATPase component TadA [Paracidobacterium acidisoli]
MSFEVIIPFLKPIEHLLRSATISEIMVNPDGSVWIEENGDIVRQSGVRFDDGALMTGLEVIANRFGKKLDADSPILNLRLPDGSRMAALIPPVVNPEPMVTIRKHTGRNFTIHDLIERKALTEAQAEVLTEHVRQGDNVLISGSTSSGKTTLANVLATFIPDNKRILIIEDVAELHINKPHVVSAEVQLDTHKSQIDFSDLLRAILRHSPGRIIIGEIRGPEARVFLDALNTGHRGSLTTIHANSAADALRRLAQLAMRGSGDGVPLHDVEEECGRSIDMIVQVVNQDGWRHVTEIRTSAEHADARPS